MDGQEDFEGYVTAVSEMGTRARTLYLHAAEGSFELIIGEDSKLGEFRGPWDLPLGQGHELRVQGRIQRDPGGSFLYVMRVTEVERGTSE